MLRDSAEALSRFITETIVKIPVIGLQMYSDPPTLMFLSFCVSRHDER